MPPTPLPGTNVIAKLQPFTTADQYATHEDKYGQGGLHACADIDGTLVATTTDADVFHDNAAQNIVFGGVDSAFGFYSRCHVQEARITLAARYSSAAYAPPAESFPVG
jgi:hypothetical protein